MRSKRWIAALTLIAACGCESNSTESSTAESVSSPLKWQPPPDSTKSLLASIAAERDAGGGVVLTGSVLLPAGTKISIYLHRGSAKRAIAQGGARLGTDGTFTSESFTDEGSSLKAGTYRVEILSYLNGIWQSRDLLEIVGDGGTRIPQSLLVPDDAEFPNAGRHFEEVREISIPALSPELLAIEAVQNSRLSIPERGLSADPVKGVVELFESGYRKRDPDALRATGWSGTLRENGLWIVTMHYLDNHKPRDAHWEFNPKTRKVRYLDPEAKIFSWSPAD